MSISKRQLIVSTVSIGLCVLMFWSKMRLGHAIADSITAAEILSDCRRLTTEISRLSHTPNRAVAKATSTDELTRLLEESARQANVEHSLIKSVVAQSPERSEGSAYDWRRTTVELEAITMEELITLLSVFAERAQSVQIESIGLAATDAGIEKPANGELGALVGETWTAKVILTQQVLSQTSKLAKG